jgi:hypothetical protein
MEEIKKRNNCDTKNNEVTNICNLLENFNNKSKMELKNITARYTVPLI